MEKANMKWSNRLREEGVEIMDSIPNMKVHSKLLQIKLEHKGKNKYIGHIGSGNFNEDTAKLYCDFSLLTSDASINKDIGKVFGLIRNFRLHSYSFKELMVSPLNTRSKLKTLIDNEIKEAQTGGIGRIILKCNSLEDTELCIKLLEAAEAGVKVDLIIRGIFRLRLKLHHKNLRAVSIVDRYLEHARVFYFYAGGKEKMYLGSADIMRRNLDFRIEVTTPIKNKNHKKTLLDMLRLQLADNSKSRLMFGKLRNKYSANTEKVVRSQLDFYKSLG